jgi:predicted dehydrogenase
MSGSDCDGEAKRQFIALRYPRFNMVNWLVIGIGDITRKRVIPAIQEEPRSVFHSVLTRNPEKATAYPAVRVHTSLEAALSDPAIHAVYVASPVALHAGQTIAALQAGKHVLCEKPTAMTFAEADTMAEAASDSGQLFGVAFYRRLYPKLIRAKRLIAEGAIGKPVLAEANHHGWLEAESRGWMRDPELAGGGPLYDTGSHRIDAFNFLFGKPLSATGLRSKAVHCFGVEDSATVLIEYPGSLHGVIDVRWTSRIVRDQFRIVGTEGELDLTPLNGPTMKITTLNGVREETLPAHRNVHYPIVENFVHAILDGTPLAAPGEEAILTDWVTGFVPPPAVR